MEWNKYFEMMIDWKKLPAYKAEPRIDSLVGFYLPEIASKFFDDKIVGIIPELPIRLGTVNKKHENTNYADRSYKVDFYLIGESGLNYFVEFKTDSASRRDKQDDYLEKSQNQGMRKITEGILKISQASTYKIKYNHLIEKLREFNLLSEENAFIGNDELKIVYVQPNNKNNDTHCIDFEWISKWIEGKPGKDSFDESFAKALKLWAKD